MPINTYEFKYRERKQRNIVGEGIEKLEGPKTSIHRLSVGGS